MCRVDDAIRQVFTEVLLQGASKNVGLAAVVRDFVVSGLESFDQLVDVNSLSGNTEKTFGPTSIHIAQALDQLRDDRRNDLAVVCIGIGKAQPGLVSVLRTRILVLTFAYGEKATEKGLAA